MTMIDVELQRISLQRETDSNQQKCDICVEFTDQSSVPAVLHYTSIEHYSDTVIVKERYTL